jgi:CheR methyltransferase, SAM binding domain
MRTASLRAEALRFLTESVLSGLIASTASRRWLNFMDAGYGLTENADVISCRNVIIYLDRSAQQSVLNKLTTHLEPGAVCRRFFSKLLNIWNLKRDARW